MSKDTTAAIEPKPIESKVNMNAPSKVKLDADTYMMRLYDFIPVNAQLIDHVRRLDGFNDKELVILKQLVTDTVQKIKQQFRFEDQTLQQDEALKKFIEATIKMHQVFSLVDTKFESVFPTDSVATREKNLSAHVEQVLTELKKHNGLNYVPRERTSDGRIFEHAADSKVMADLLARLPGMKASGPVAGYRPPQSTDATFYVQIVDEVAPASGDKPDTQHVELMSKYEQKIMEELNITKDKNIVLKINRSFIDLAMQANGKADLYFHAYFWQEYLKNLEQTQTKAGGQKIDIFSDQFPFSRRLQGLAMTLTKVIVNIKKFPFDKKSYEKFINEFGKRQLQKKTKYLEEIQRSLFVAQIANDQQGLYWIEKLLIQLLGYCDMSIRDQAIVLLNMLYDGVDWQLLEAFRPTIRSVGQHFIIECIVHKSQKSSSQIFLGLGAPSPIMGQNSSILTWHKVEPRNILEEDNVMQKIQINFGKFWKCGFYDWRLVSVSDDGKLQPLEIIGKPDPVFPHVEDHDEYYEQNMEEDVGSIAQGRFVVHARGMRDHTFHEVQIDHQDAKVDKTSNTFVQRGTFMDVEANIPSYAQQGISCLYLMGTLERDNYPYNQQYGERLEFRRDDASPLASIDRSRPNRMLGGEKGFMGVMKAAKQSQVKIVTDCLARISSSRHHRKYKDLLLHYLDEDGRRHICYGTDGQAQKFEDTAMLNYRKLDAWELLIDEVVTYTQKFGIDGIHLDNGQAWPQIMEPDTEELQRLDVDGVPCYSAEDFMNGEVVIRNENHGYWNSNNMETYPNPFFIKLCRKLWTINPDFMVIGECWGGYMFEHRQIILARSGIIPRLFRLPVALSAIMGKRLFNDGRIESCGKQETGVSIKNWYEESRKFLPDGTILMQSSTSHTLPLPAYLYGQGTWAAIDTLFFMPGIPITFMGELEGQVYKIGEVATVFQQEQSKINTTGNPGELRRTNSQIMKMLKDGEELTNTSTDHNTLTPPVPEQRRGLPKVRSGVNIGQLYVEAKDGQFMQKEQEFKENLNPSKGFDLSQIDTHYLSRRQLRKQKMVLRYGELIVLAAKDLQHKLKPEILCYARYALTETLIIATNMSDTTQKFLLDMQNLIPTFKKAYGNNVVVMVKPVLSDDTEPDYYFLREFIEARNIKLLPAYRSLMISLNVCDDDQFIFKKCLTNSIERTKKNLLAGHSIEDEQISLLFSDCVMQKPEDIHRFANVIGSIQHSFLDKLNIQFRDLYTKNSKLVNNEEYAARLIAMTGYLLKNGKGDMIAPLRAAQSMHDGDQLGPIVFCTPELGKWSTVGGLGVMVDELSIGLADLGQEVIVISPYYHRNRKGATDYIHPDGIYHKDNLFVDISGGVEMGVHEGMYKGVHLVFLHNADVFPSPYPDNGPVFATHQISVFGKACLQYCCNRGKIPAICITNDWFTGFVAAYGKRGHFGDTFRGTQFVHICHNLQETYEGRIYLDPCHGTLDQVHQLPTDVIIDGSWEKKLINPSRCAIICSDQWATVSKSYRDDLLNGSSLANFLRQKPQPFAFPNGIPIKERIKKLDASAPDHITAKKYLQQKYFQFGELDDSIPLFAFVGRITSQKGVHLILDVAEHLIHRFQFKIQFLVGGPANQKEPYAAGCAGRMWHLRNAYPNCFWAAPDEFFYDGSLVNRGADFGLMPSLFEPGGIVQHEFFVGGTPVVAFKTGGLKDSVLEYMWDTESGSGYTFESHNGGDLIQAIDRAVGTYHNKQKYLKLRENAFKATMDGEIVSRAWLGEFFRLSGKKYYDFRIVKALEKKFLPWAPQDYEPISIIQEIFGTERKKQIFQEIDFGATDGESKVNDSNELDMISAFDKQSFNKISHTFTMPNRGPRHNRVQLCGSFDNWTVRHEMNFDPFTNQWFMMMHMRPGDEYFYKYIINDNDWVVNDDEPKRMDEGGNLNNFVVFEI